MDYEQYLRDRIADLQREYQKAAEPYIQKLVELEAMKPPQPIIVHWSDVPPDEQDRILREAGMSTMQQPLTAEQLETQQRLGREAAMEA